MPKKQIDGAQTSCIFAAVHHRGVELNFTQ